MKKIVVEKYNKKWKSEFEKAKIFYENLLVDLDIIVEHVGSTSVEGLMAKPILDIDIIVKNNEVSQQVIKLLEGVDYHHIGNLGLEGREAFGYDDDNKYINWMSHHLYVCLEDSENLKNHLLLRSHLRNNKESVKEYGELKLELSKKFTYDIDSYIDAKTDLIISFLEREGMNKEKLSRIEGVNKK